MQNINNSNILSMDRDVLSLRASSADSLICTDSMASGTGMLVNRAVTS